MNAVGFKVDQKWEGENHSKSFSIQKNITSPWKLTLKIDLGVLDFQVRQLH